MECLVKLVGQPVERCRQAGVAGPGGENAEGGGHRDNEGFCRRDAVLDAGRQRHDVIGRSLERAIRVR